MACAQAGGAPAGLPTGAILTLDARESMTLISGNVDTWPDQTGTQDATQASASNRPPYEATGLNGGPSVRFTVGAAQRYLNLTGLTQASGTYTVGLIMEWTDTSGAFNGNLLHVGTDNVALGYRSSGTSKYAYFDTANRGLTTTVTTTAQRLLYQVGATGYIWKNGTQIDTFAAANKAIGGTITLGGNNTHTTTAECRLGLLAIWPRAQDAGERAAFDAVAAAGWGL